MKERAWTIYASGDTAAFERVKPVLAVFADNVPFVGKVGNGTKMKFLANHLVAILNVASAESLTCIGPRLIVLLRKAVRLPPGVAHAAPCPATMGQWRCTMALRKVANDFLNDWIG